MGFPTIGFIRWLFYVCIERQIFLSDLKTRAPPTVSDALVIAQITHEMVAASRDWLRQYLNGSVTAARRRFAQCRGRLPHRVNWMHFTVAREWANRGYVAFRMDLAGRGDSVRYRTDA